MVMKIAAMPPRDLTDGLMEERVEVLGVHEHQEEEDPHRHERDDRRTRSRPGRSAR